MDKRLYGLDLLRIIAAFFIIIIHILGQGGILIHTAPDRAAFWFSLFLASCAYCTVNCFAMISGYILSEKSIRIKSLISLWFQVLFYSLLITFLFFIFVPETRTINNLVSAFFPVLGNQWWYISSYFALTCFIPILNAAIRTISRDAFRLFLLTVLSGIGILDCIHPGDPFMINQGYSFVWICVMYLFGAYIRKYAVNEKITASRSLLFFLFMILLTILGTVFVQFVTEHFFGRANTGTAFMSQISITTILASVFIFLCFLNVSVNNFLQKLTTIFAPAVLGVYLIHVHPLVFEFIIKDAFVPLTYSHSVIIILGIAASSFVILMLCFVIEFLRIRLFRLFRINCLCERIAEKVSLFFTKSHLLQT